MHATCIGREVSTTAVTVLGSASYRVSASPEIVVLIKPTLDPHQITRSSQVSGSTTGPTNGYSYGGTAGASGTIGPVGVNGSMTGSRNHTDPVQTRGGQATQQDQYTVEEPRGLTVLQTFVMPQVTE